MKTCLLFTCLLLIVAAAKAEPDISINGLFTGKAIIQIDGQPIMFFEGDKRQGIKLLSANEDRAIIEVGGKRRTMLLDKRIANEYSKPVTAPDLVSKSIIRRVELVYQAHNIATFAVTYYFSEQSEQYQLMAQVMVDKKAVDYVNYNYVPVKAGEHTTHITLGINEVAPTSFSSDHILVNFMRRQNQQILNADSAKIIALSKQWRH